VSLALDIERVSPEWADPLQEPRRYKGASGGRASGKSHEFAAMAVEAMVCDPDLRFVCIREVQRSLKFSAKSLVEKKIIELGVSSLFEVLQTEIRRRDGRGVMIFEGMQDHTADSIKSLEGFGRAWVEEAQSISQRSLDLLLPTIRADDSELWFSWNPYQPTDPIDAFFASEPPSSVRVHTTYRDNPFCPRVMHDEAARLLATDPDAYANVWEGGYYLGGSGRVYSSYSGKAFPLGNIDDTVQDTGAELLIGMDFNVNPMSCVLGVRAGDECHILDSLQIKSSNTEEVAAEIRRRYPTRRIIVCPDPSGRARKSSAPVGQTDFTILERAGFVVAAPTRAPLVVDRVNNANALYLDRTTGRRRVRIHPRAAALTLALAHLVYKDGTSQPDKSKGYDHICDALDYLLWSQFPAVQHEPAVALSRIRL